MKTFRNGSKESLPETIERIEQRLNKLRSDLQTLHNQKNPENGFKKFAQNIADRRN